MEKDLLIKIKTDKNGERWEYKKVYLNPYIPFKYTQASYKNQSHTRQ